MLQTEFLKHLETPDKNRDNIWENEFLKLFSQVNIDLKYDIPKQGPDGMSYMLVSINKDSTEPSIKLLNWAYDKGVGIVLNPEKKFPDFIFTYGMIWNFKETNHFLSKFKEKSRENIILPNYVKLILNNFLSIKKFTKLDLQY